MEAFGFEPKEEYPHAGLGSFRKAFTTGISPLRKKVHNYCRNPTNDTSGAYCLTKESFSSLTGVMNSFDKEEVDENGIVAVESNTSAATRVNAADGRGNRRLFDRYSNANVGMTGTMRGATYESCDVPVCDACSCMPPCGTPNLEPCGCPSFFQSEECCIIDANTLVRRISAANATT